MKFFSCPFPNSFKTHTHTNLVKYIVLRNLIHNSVSRVPQGYVVIFWYLLTFLQETLVPKLIDSFESGTDTDTRVLDAYIKQCTAEAQEGIRHF